MKKRIKTFLKIYPWYYSISCWLLFFDIINTIYLTTVKGLSAAEFSLLLAISLTVSILLHIPFLHIIKKWGNTFSLRFGNFLFIISAIMLTFCNSFWGLTIGKTLYEVSFIFKEMLIVELRRNLIYIHKEDDFIQYSNNATMNYTIIALATGLLAGPLFNIHSYIPMYLAIVSTLICFYLSFYLFDVSEERALTDFSNISKKVFSHKKKITILFIFILIAYGLGMGIIDIGQNQAKLFVQYELEDGLGLKITALVFGSVVALSNIPAIFSNMIFPKIYQKIHNNSGYLLSGLLIISFLLLLFGYFVPLPFGIRITIMFLGFLLILMLRGPCKNYYQDLALKHCQGEEEQDMAIYLSLSRDAFGAAISGVAAFILLDYPLEYVMIMLIIVSVIQLFLFYKVHQLIIVSEKTAN